MSVKETLLLVGHGSKLPYSKELLVDIAEKVRARGQFENIEIGLMEFNEPTIPQALLKAIDNGSKKIIVMPVFLAPGTHTTKDIPYLLGLLNEEKECADNHDHSFSDKILNMFKSSKHDHNHDHGHHHHHHHGEKPVIPADVEIIYKSPLGADDRIVDIIMDRVLTD